MRKIVLTGGPCTGKSSLIKELQDSGFHVLKEIAREILTERKSINYNTFELEQEIAKRQVMRENHFDSTYPRSEFLFLDRGLVDVVAYCSILLGRVPEDISYYEFRNRYETVFFLDRLPLEEDGVRLESNEEEAERIHLEIYKTYLSLGYKPIKIPIVNSAKERMSKVLENVQELKGGEKQNGRML